MGNSRYALQFPILSLLLAIYCKSFDNILYIMWSFCGENVLFITGICLKEFDVLSESQFLQFVLQIYRWMSSHDITEDSRLPAYEEP